MSQHVLRVGEAVFSLEIADGFLRSLGDIRIGGTALRNPATRFLPWFDTYEGDVFRHFRFLGVSQRGKDSVIGLKAVSDPDYPFMERRDSSGDIVVRNTSWDAPPLEADFRIVLSPVQETIEGRKFTGFRYGFEYESDRTPIHRMADRQTWEIGGNLDDVTIVCRNLFDAPRKKVGKDGGFSTVGLDMWAGLLPGNLWGRWSLLPGFDMQYGSAGVMLGWFDQVSCIRTVIESMPGEDWIRHVDLHYFEKSTRVQTNPRTIVWSPDRLDSVDALNLWTRVYDRDQEKACRQFSIKDEPPPFVTLAQNFWKDFNFATSYDACLDVAAEFGVDNLFIDPIWEHGEAMRRTLIELVPEEKRKGSLLDKFFTQNMCCTYDFEVAEVMGGEKGLKNLCDRARAKGIRVLSWMAAHYTPYSTLRTDKSLAHGNCDLFAAKESGRHPDTGYPGDCWTANLNGPVFEKIRKQLLGVCERTGLGGFLWDSFSNLGWWQVDYSKGTMRPQFDKMAQLYAELTNAGLYVQPESILSFSNHSCCGLHGGNVYAGDLLGYSYKTVIDVSYDGKTQELEILKGEKPIDELFQCYAHMRVPTCHYQELPREKWNAQAAAALRDLNRVYRKVRPMMKKRTVLKDGGGVLWENGSGESILFSFKPQDWDGKAVEALSDQPAAGRRLKANTVYRVKAE